MISGIFFSPAAIFFFAEGCTIPTILLIVRLWWVDPVLMFY